VAGAGFTKLTVYALPGDDPAWRRMGFRREGTICGFFPAHIDAELWAAYPDPRRAHDPRRGESDAIVEVARGKQPRAAALPAGYQCRR
jgi:hypothetical protein